MKKKLLAGLIGMMMSFGAVVSAYSTVLTFDEMEFMNDSTPLPDDYMGLSWNNWRVWDELNKNSPTYSGHNSITSFSTTPTILSGTVENFDFTGTAFTAVTNDGLNVRVIGSSNNNVLYDTTIIIVDSISPTWFQFDYLGIDELTFFAFGGTFNPEYDAGGLSDSNDFLLDNFTFQPATDPSAVPEPGTMILFCSGLVALAGFKQRKK